MLKYIYESQKTDFMLLLRQIPPKILYFSQLSVAYHFETSYIFCSTLTLALFPFSLRVITFTDSARSQVKSSQDFFWGHKLVISIVEM